MRHDSARWSQVGAKEKSADALYWKVRAQYIEGPGGIDWAESVVAGLHAVLSLSPDHVEALRLKNDISAYVPTLGKQADALVQEAARKLAFDDLSGCIDLIARHCGLDMRFLDAQDVLDRVKQRAECIAGGDSGTEDAIPLLKRISVLEALWSVVFRGRQD